MVAGEMEARGLWMEVLRTYPRVPLHLEDLDALDDGGARVVDAVEECLAPRSVIAVPSRDLCRAPTFNWIMSATLSPLVAELVDLPVAVWRAWMGCGLGVAAAKAACSASAEVSPTARFGWPGSTRPSCFG